MCESRWPARGCRGLGFGAALGWVAACWLVTPGAVGAQSSIATDGTLPGVVARDLPGPDYAVSEAEGLRVGNSQFHSFERFGLATGETVTFSGPDTIARIISRVTGGSLSEIDGQVRSEIDGADFYLINPQGVVFHENASLNVPGDVVVSSADFVELGDDGVFHASLPASTVLSASPVAAFGFLSDSPAAIRVLGSRLETNFITLDTLVGRSLSLVGGDLEIRGSGQPDDLTFLYSRGGRINLASLGSSGRVEIVEAEPGVADADLLVTADGEQGEIFIGDGAVVSSGGPPPDTQVCVTPGCFIANGSGDIFVRGHDLTIEDGEIRALTVTDRDAGRIDIDLTGDLVVRSVNETATTGISGISGLEFDFGGEGPLMRTARLQLPEGEYVIEYDTGFGANAEITAIRYPGTGRGGDISIKARNVGVEGFAEITSESIFAGDAGDVTIVADDSVTISAAGRTGEFGSILSNARRGGEGGAVSITARDLQITDNGRILTEVRGGAGAGGSITIEVDRLAATADGRIDSSTRGTGPGGDISITARESILLSGQESQGTFSGVSTLSQPDGTGRAGNITLSTPTLRIEDGAQVTTTALVTGDAGVIDVRADSMSLRDAAVTAESDSGLGGDIYINGGPVVVLPEGGLEIDAPPGVEPGNVLYLSDSLISTSVNGSGGSGGDVAIAANTIVLIGSEILARAVDEAGGNMRIEASAVVLDEASDIDATSVFSQDGTIDIASPTVIIRGERPDLPAQIRDATEFLRERCAARNGEAAASLVLRTRSGLPASPEGLLSAPTPDVEDADRVAEEGSGTTSLAQGEPARRVTLRLGCRG